VATLVLSLALLGFANAIWNPNSPHAIPNLVATGGVTVFGVVLFHYLLSIPFPLLRGFNL